MKVVRDMLGYFNDCTKCNQQCLEHLKKWIKYGILYLVICVKEMKQVIFVLRFLIRLLNMILFDEMQNVVKEFYQKQKRDYKN